MARVRVPKRTYAFQFHVRATPGRRCWPLGLASLRPCTNFTLGTYGFSVSCLAFSPADNTYAARVLSLAPSLPSSSPGRRRPSSLSFPSLCQFHILAVAHTCRVCVRRYLPLPSRGICTVSHKRVRPNLPLPHAANGIQIFLSLPRSFASFPPLSRFHLLPRNSPFLLASFSCVCTFAGELFTGEFFSFFLFPLFLFCFAQGVFLSSRLISLFFFF